MRLLNALPALVIVILAVAPVYCTVEVLAVKLPEITNGVPVAESIIVRLPLPASSVVEPEIVRIPETVIEPVPA